jgi:hypothetical protein
MNNIGKNRLSLVVAAALVACAVLAIGYFQPAHAQRDSSSGVSPRYSIVETQGHNLIVADNQSNTLFFYTIDRDREVGTELKLRGQIDLNQVGKPTIKPHTHKAAE